MPGVGAAVQSIQSAAEQSLSAAMVKMQVHIGEKLTSIINKSLTEMNLVFVSPGDVWPAAGLLCRLRI